MRSATSLFNTLITDGSTTQDCILINCRKDTYPTGMFSALDGDFTSDGVTIEETECETDDISFGNACSSQISFSLINERGWMLADFPWGRMSCLIAVKHPMGSTNKFPSEEYATVSNATAFVRNYIASRDYYAINNKLYKRDYTRAYDPDLDRIVVTPGTASLIYTASSGTVFTGLLEYDDYLIAIGAGVCVVYDRDAGSASTFTPNRHLANKLMIGTSYSFYSFGPQYKYYMRCTPQGNGKYLCENFVAVNMGKYEIERPDLMLNDVVEVNDAPNVLANLDVDATNFLNSITYPTTMKAIAEAAVAYADADATISSPNISEYTASIASSPFGSGSYTVRDILKRISEAIGRNVVADGGDSGTSTVRLKYAVACNAPGDYVESIDWSRIASGSLKIKSYMTRQIKTLLLKKQDGTIVERNVGSLVASGIYEISNNPFVQSLPYDGVLVESFPTAPTNNPWMYYPASLTVIYANPLVELGDTIRVESAEEQYTPQYDVYGRPTGLQEYHAPIYIPLMHRTLHWQGYCFADYEANGNAVRYANTDTQAYQSNVAMDYADSLEDMLSTRIFNIEDNLGVRETAADATGVDVPSGTATNVNSIAIDTGHTYIVTAHLNFPSNSTGVRGLYVASTSGSTTAVNGGGRIVLSAADGEATRMTCTFVMRTTSITTLYLTAYQTSGSTLNVTSYMDVLRII